jgi:hypothetical protein
MAYDTRYGPRLIAQTTRGIRRKTIIIAAHLQFLPVSRSFVAMHARQKATGYGSTKPGNADHEGRQMAVKWFNLESKLAAANAPTK